LGRRLRRCLRFTHLRRPLILLERSVRTEWIEESIEMMLEEQRQALRELNQRLEKIRGYL
jgi:hypothetical protein